ncbi:SMI1/KNR4 family protein [Paenibacillus sp. CGMCC 1.16610]|uniref:Knr4/Smi1-like domain-containing protein n=1 Tax=Paenibacillus anseongense TaxID=2682845 RepID=A0ABW9U2T5_9BACL|nr:MULTISPECIES: SMI1/KNR4 family protein [Paenibacillus]MBA2937051.1 SMI1/KNR4 family protein [Paenibacillus sp. CGMCC 1.16610]MVQ33374.1 hypothetical protein [Paenibacillus anseongense]
MQIEMEISFPVILVEKIKYVERRYEVNFPEDYREFLLQFNGGKPSKRRFASKDGKIISSLMLLFPLMEKEGKSVVEHYLMFTKSGRLPVNIVPIGEDPLRNLICISVGSSDTGSVYYWNLNENEIGPSYKYLYLLSESFSEFIKGLLPSK